jgi:glucan phosphoethanolaminetransferase (alkaline phosphatase superfamily)
MSYSKTFKKLIDIKNFKDFNPNEFFNNISTSKLFLGLMMIFMNLGSRYIEIKLTKGQEMILKNIAREVLIFTIAFMGSRDIFIALIITAVFIILSNFVFNENSKYCILLHKYKKLANVMDTDGDGKVSQEELDKAYDILKRAGEQEQLHNKINMLNNIAL